MVSGKGIEDGGGGVTSTLAGGGEGDGPEAISGSVALLLFELLFNGGNVVVAFHPSVPLLLLLSLVSFVWRK